MACKAWMFEEWSEENQQHFLDWEAALLQSRSHAQPSMDTTKDKNTTYKTTGDSIEDPIEEKEEDEDEE